MIWNIISAFAASGSPTEDAAGVPSRQGVWCIGRADFNAWVERLEPAANVDISELRRFPERLDESGTTFSMRRAAGCPTTA